MEDTLKRLDKLTQEEARMAVAQNLKVTHAVHERLKGVANTMIAMDDKVAGASSRHLPTFISESLRPMVSCS